MLPAANYLDVDVHFLDPTADAPCSTLSTGFQIGSFNNYDQVMAFGKNMDLVSIEIENVNVDALEDLEKLGVKVCPSPTSLRIIKDKGIQKQFYADNRIPTSNFQLTKAGEGVSEAQLPVVQKLRTGGYDGKGVKVLTSAADLADAFQEACVLEDLVTIAKELSVIVARNQNGDVKVFPVVELVFDPKANLVDYLLSPANIDEATAQQAKDLAMKVVTSMDYVGLLAVELFLQKDGQVLVNEIAPRTHNSGHQSIEGNYTSQFEQHLRAILNLPLGNPDARGVSTMVNLVGEEGFTGPVVYEGMDELLGMDKVYPHLYGKTHTKPYRKMGHVTALANSSEEAIAKAMEIKKTVRVIAD
ncbi:MAG: 5-(carboxyamino)imidazole ribonucleotide synthase, partial [Flavobacteriales bacterium]